MTKAHEEGHEGLVARVAAYARRSGVSWAACVEGLDARERWDAVRRALAWLRSWSSEGLTRGDRRAIAHHWATAARAAALAAACAGCASTPSSKPIATVCGVARAACAVVEAACGVAETSGGATP